MATFLSSDKINILLTLEDFFNLVIAMDKSFSSKEPSFASSLRSNIAAMLIFSGFNVSSKSAEIS